MASAKPTPQESPIEVAVNTNRLFVEGYSAVLEFRFRNLVADEAFRVEGSVSSKALPNGARWALTLEAEQHRREMAELVLPRSCAGRAGSAGESAFQVELIIDAGPDGRHRFAGCFMLTVLEFAASPRDINVHIEKLVEQHVDMGAIVEMAPINVANLGDILRRSDEQKKSLNDLLAEERPPRFVPIELRYDGVVVPGVNDAPRPVPLGKVAVLCSDRAPEFYEIRAEWTAIGRSRTCHLCLDAPHVSSHHATLARVASGVLIVDHSSQNGTWLDGQKIAHQFLQSGDAVRIDKFWLVCRLTEEQALRAVDNELRETIGGTKGATLVQEDQSAETAANTADGARANAQVRLAASSGRQVATDGKPILIGHDSTCRLRLGGDGVARFHAMVYWDRSGVWIEDLHSGQGMPVVNGKPVGQALLRDRDVVEIGGHRIAISLLGDVEARAQVRAALRPTTRGLAITCVEGPGRGESCSLGLKVDSLIVGRDGACHWRLPSSGLADHHAEIRRTLVEADDGTCRPEYAIRDLGSVTGTSINGHRLGPAEHYRIEPGDVVRLGSRDDHCDLLVHCRL